MRCYLMIVIALLVAGCKTEMPTEDRGRCEVMLAPHLRELYESAHRDEDAACKVHGMVPGWDPLYPDPDIQPFECCDPRHREMDGTLRRGCIQIKAPRCWSKNIKHFCEGLARYETETLEALYDLLDVCGVGRRPGSFR